MKEESKKYMIVSEICDGIDRLYYHAKVLIPKDKTHNLGYKKEALKILVEKTIFGSGKFTKKVVGYMLWLILFTLTIYTLYILLLNIFKC